MEPHNKQGFYHCLTLEMIFHYENYGIALKSGKKSGKNKVEQHKLTAGSKNTCLSFLLGPVHSQNYIIFISM